MTHNIFDNDAEAVVFDRNKLDGNSEVKTDFASAVLSGDEAETGLTIEFGAYAALMGKTVNEAYSIFEEKHPNAQSGSGTLHANYNRFCDDLEILVDAKIIEPLQEAGDHGEVFDKGDRLVVTDHGSQVSERYLTQAPV